MKKIVQIYFLVVISFLSTGLGAQQSPVCMLPDLTAVHGDELEIPVTVKGFQQIGAVSLTMEYDPAAITYNAYNNTSGFPGLIVFNPFDGLVVVSGYNTLDNGFSLGDGDSLFSMFFTSLGGKSSLHWLDNGVSCELSGPLPEYQPLNDLPKELFFLDGSVNQSFQTLQGTVKYYTWATQGTALAGFEIELLDGQGQILASTLSGPDGNYLFDPVPENTVYIEIPAPAGWGGCNATDALAIQKHAIGQPVNFWFPDEFITEVADVTSSGIVNSTDALAVMQRSIGLIDAFDAGDRAFYAPRHTFTFSGPHSAVAPYNGNSRCDIFCMNYGDVNGSYNAERSGTSKTELISRLLPAEIEHTMVCSLDLSCGNETGAFTIYLNYNPDAVSVMEVQPALSGMLCNITDNRVSLAWKSLDPVSPEEISIASLVLKQKNSAGLPASVFSIGKETEFADVDCNVIRDVKLTLSTPSAMDHKSFKTSGSVQHFSCFPNPARDSFTLEFELIETANVQISLHNISGELMKVLVQDHFPEGTSGLQYSAHQLNLKKGIYLIKYKSQGASQKQKDVERLIIL